MTMGLEPDGPLTKEDMLTPEQCKALVDEFDWSNQLNPLAYQIAEWRKSKGFHTPDSIDSEEDRDAMLGKLMLVVTEVAEAAEAIRGDHEDSFEEEIADAIIRLLDISGSMCIDIEQVIGRKMDKNAGRAQKHGKSTSL
jgi:NTP pyrophosphatase (non-canonical NTP hydrolase)